MRVAGERLFEYGDHWIARVTGSPNLYAHWWDQRSGRTRRKSLGTAILDEARERLVELVGVARQTGDRSPERVMICVALAHYYDNDVSLKPSEGPAKRAVALATGFLRERMTPTAAVASFGPMRQEEFAHWSAETLGHSSGTIARNLSVFSAAFRYGTRTVVVTNGFGERQEVRLLDSAPAVITSASKISEWTKLPPSTPRKALPTFEQLGALINAIDKRQENLFRFIILALNTWARPEAITDLRIGEQVDRRASTVDLNPPGRRQTKKFRPVIPLTENLAGWLDEWKEDAPLRWNGEAVTTLKKTFRLHARDCGLASFTQYTLRHFMATEARKYGASQEQRDLWLGHGGMRRTATWYEHNDPDFLSEAREATDSVIRELQKHTRRPLFARKERAKETTMPPTAGRPEGDVIDFKREDGGRAQDRTVDPYDVNVVLSR